MNGWRSMHGNPAGTDDRVGSRLPREPSPSVLPHCAGVAGYSQTAAALPRESGVIPR